MILRTLSQRLHAALTPAPGVSCPGAAQPISLAALDAALASLPEVSRTVFLLHARDQLTLGDIARRLGLTADEAEQHLASALVHLDRQIGTISPAGTVASGSADR